MLADWRSRQESLQGTALNSHPLPSSYFAFVLCIHVRQGTALIHTFWLALFRHFAQYLTVWGVEPVVTH